MKYKDRERLLERKKLNPRTQNDLQIVNLS